MSINLSFSNKFKKTETPAAEDETKKKNKAAKQNPLLNTKTDPYVDDNDLYVPRISRMDRYDYWLKLLPNRGPRRPLPKAFVSWKSRELASVNEQANYYRIHIMLFNIVKNKNWDHRYINLFIVWILLIIFFVDGWADNLAPFLVEYNTGNQILAIPPFLMFITQLIPFLGMLYFITHCNDLVHFKAVKEIGTWAFAAALTAQYCEFFLYRGQGHPERAGNCKKGHEPNPRPLYDYFKRVLNTVRGRNHARVDREQDGDNTLEADEDREPEEEPDLEKGKPKGGLKSALKKPAPSEDESESAENQSQSTKKKKKKKKSEKRKNSATIAASDTESRASERDRRKSGELVDFDAEGNEIKKVPVPHTDWTCVVCNTANHEPTHGPVESDIWFGEKGVHYKRTYAVIQARRDVPTCKRCGTYADYHPPLGSAHLFAHNPKPHQAFEDYPKPSAVQAGLKPDIQSRYYYYIKGFFLGIKDDFYSAPLKNDWRLEKFVNARFPELPRYILQPGELYQEGEIVECRQQKFEWARARIMVAHANHTYDIRYDPGDEIRFVEGTAIRTIPDKRAFAFRVEMGLVLIVLVVPLGLAVGVLNNNPGLGFIAPLVVSVVLLAVRVVMFCQYFYNYYHAGLIAVIKLSSIYFLPLLFLLIASAVGIGSGTSPGALMTVAVMLILTKIFTVPFLYIYRPVYLVIGAISFVQTSIGFVLLAMYAANPAALVYIAIPLAPFLTDAIFFKVLRHFLHTVWDVCLIIRKTKDTEFENPSIVGKAKDFIMEYLDP